MPAWLTPAWVDASDAAVGTWPPSDRGQGAEQAEAGASSTGRVNLTVTVTGGCDGDVTYPRTWWAAGDGPARELAMTLPASDARGVLAGELSPSVAFMQGRLKIKGDPGAALEVLAATAEPWFATALERVRSVTAAPTET